MYSNFFNLFITLLSWSSIIMKALPRYDHLLHCGQLADQCYCPVTAPHQLVSIVFMLALTSIWHPSTWSSTSHCHSLQAACFWLVRSERVMSAQPLDQTDTGTLWQPCCCCCCCFLSEINFSDDLLECCFSDSWWQAFQIFSFLTDGVL